MSARLEDQIRRYTETMDAMAPPIEELVPTGMAEEIGLAPGETVEITIPLLPLPRRRTPSWLYGVAAAVVVALAAVPVWLWLNDQNADVVTTTPPPSSVPTIPIPESLDLSQYPLVFDRDSDKVIGTGWASNEEVVASLDNYGVVTTLSAMSDDRGGFAIAGFDCCADTSVLTVTQGGRTETARIDRGIAIDRLDADRDLVTLAYGMNLEITLVFESGEDIYTTTVMPDSDWWSLDLSGDLDVVPGMRVTALFESGPVAFVVSRTTGADLGAEVNLTQQTLHGRGFVPDSPLGVTINGVDLPGGAATDAGGQFEIDLEGRGVVVDRGYVITLSQAGETFQLPVLDLTFIRFDPDTGVAAGTISGTESWAVTIRVREANGEIRQVAPFDVSLESGIWQARFGPLEPGESVELAWASAIGSTFLRTEAQLNPTLNPHLGLDEPFGNVSGHEFDPGTTVMVRVNGGEWTDIGNTNPVGSFDVNSVVEVGPGDVLEVEIGGTTRSLTIPELSFDVYDPDTRIASGTTDLSDGTILSLHVFPTQTPVWETYEIQVVGGEWSFEIPVDFSAGWPRADITWFPDGAVYSAHFTG